MKPWLWPLPGAARAVPPQGHDGGFGTRRHHEVHAGVDLYCSIGQEVCAVADGRVLLVIEFTGPLAGSPWWHPTKAVVVRHAEDCIVVYGEVEPLPEIRNGMSVQRGQPLGRVLRVRKNDDGKPTTMLHLELWSGVECVMDRYTDANADVANDWPLDGQRPKGLLNPSARLEQAEVQ